MFCWRIIKYDPKYRDKNGFYTREEWTSFSEIGKVFDNKLFTYRQYCKIEDAYVQSIQLFMDCLSLDSLQVTDLEKHDKRENIFYDSSMLSIFESVKNNDNLNKRDISTLSRLVLRENLWCKLQSENMFVHFGYDYYMYIGSNMPCKSVISTIQELGLFIGVYNSPYLE